MLFSPGEAGYTVLGLATANYHINVVKLLVEKFKVDPQIRQHKHFNQVRVEVNQSKYYNKHFLNKQYLDKFLFIFNIFSLNISDTVAYCFEERLFGAYQFFRWTV